MEQLHTRLRTWFPSARWVRLWRSPKGDVATASAAPGPVGYLVNHPGGWRPRGCPRHRLRLRAGIGGRLRPVPGCPPDGAGPGRPRRGARACSRRREGATHPRPHPGAALRAGAALVPGRPGHRATVTSRASASTASPDASTPHYRSCVSASGSTATSPRWTGPRSSTARTPAFGSGEHDTPNE